MIIAIIFSLFVFSITTSQSKSEVFIVVTTNGRKPINRLSVTYKAKMQCLQCPHFNEVNNNKEDALKHRMLFQFVFWSQKMLELC